MKLFILKLLSLLVFIVGLVSLLVALGLPEAKAYLDQVPALVADLQSKLPPQLKFLKEVLTMQGLWFTGSIAAIVFGIYGFAPRSAKWRKPKKITYEGPHGEVQIQLDTVEQSLNHVLARMPEIKRINVKVEPQDGGRRALIRAEVVLLQRPGQNARALASLVTDYIAETASKLLGLEDLATIELKVTGIVVNSKKSSKAIRKESLSHSANAPVELLEAAPAPLTLSGPREPLGSGPLEEELEADSDEAMETVAVDTRHDVSSQAAARSELLEPLNLGKTAANSVGSFHEGTSSSSGGDVVEAQAAEAASSSFTEADTTSPVMPLAMDVLDEPLSHGADTHYPPLPSDESDVEPYRAEITPDSGGLTDGEALDDDPAYGGTLADEVEDHSEEAQETSEENPTPFDEDVDPEEDSHGGFQAGGDVDEVGTIEMDPNDTQPGEVTIPEGDDDPNSASPEKKRWGWFN